jgi:hypothetical protein
MTALRVLVQRHFHNVISFSNYFFIQRINRWQNVINFLPTRMTDSRNPHGNIVFIWSHLLGVYLLLSPTIGFPKLRTAGQIGRMFLHSLFLFLAILSPISFSLSLNLYYLFQSGFYAHSILAFFTIEKVRYEEK